MRRNLSVSLVGLTLLAPRGAAAQVFTWIGPPAGSWSNPANWSGGAVPTAQSTVIIDGAPGQNTNVAIDVPASITALSLSAGDSATVLDGRLLRFDGSPLSTIDGPGMLVLGSPTGAAQVSADRSIRLSGGGTMNLAGLGLLNAGLRIEQSAYSILGTGLISALVHQLDAQSRIEARPAPGAAGAFATLQLTVVHDISNAGTMSAATGGTLLINSSALFSTGTVCAADGATVTFTRDTTLVGGTYGTAGSGVIVAQPSAANDRIELRDVNLAGLFRSERAETRIVGSLANSGTLLVQTPGTVVRLGTGTTHFSGNGAIRLGGTAILADATATLRQSGGHGIRGDTDATGVSVGAVLNEGGVIDADVPGRRLTLAPAVAISNSGTLSAGNGGELLIGGTAATLDNRFGVIAARGAGSQVRIERPLRIFGGSTQTDAAGEVVFDAPTGTLTLDNLVNNGRLRVQSGTLSAGASGLLINNGTLSAATIALDGTMTLVGAGQFNAAGWITNGAIINLGNRIGGQGLIDGVDNRAGGIVDASGTQLFLRGARANAGLMRASNGGTLYAGFLDNTGGRIEAAAGSQVNLLGAINTGTLAALAGGSFTANTNGATLGNGVTLLGPGAFGTGTQSGFQPIRYTLLNGQSMSVGDNPVLEGSTFSVSGSASVNLIGAERAVTLKDMTLNAGAATLNVGPGTLNLQGRVTNRLNINLSSISTQYPILMPVGVATLTGGGTILAAGGSSGGGRLVNLDNTIYLDSAFFGLWAGGWENYGALRGRGGNSSLYLRGTTSINRGLISSGVLTHFQMVGSGGPQAPVLLDNAGGVIESVGNSSITLENTVIQGGAINATFGRVIAHGEGSVTLRDVSISGDKLETGYGRLRLESFNTLAPGGMITVGHAVEDGGELLVSSQGTLTGSGSIRLLPKGRVAGAGRLTLEGITVFGVGRVGSGLTSLTLDPGSSLIARRSEGFPGGLGRGRGHLRDHDQPGPVRRRGRRAARPAIRGGRQVSRVGRLDQRASRGERHHQRLSVERATLQRRHVHGARPVGRVRPGRGLGPGGGERGQLLRRPHPPARTGDLRHRVGAAGGPGRDQPGEPAVDRVVRPAGRARQRDGDRLSGGRPVAVRPGQDLGEQRLRGRVVERRGHHQQPSAEPDRTVGRRLRRGGRDRPGRGHFPWRACGRDGRADALHAGGRRRPGRERGRCGFRAPGGGVQPAGGVVGRGFQLRRHGRDRGFLAVGGEFQPRPDRRAGANGRARAGGRRPGAWVCVDPAVEGAPGLTRDRRRRMRNSPLAAAGSSFHPACRTPGRRGRFRTETERMMTWPASAPPGRGARDHAASMSRRTYGSSKSVARVKRRERTWLPWPRSRFCGSGSPTPRRKHRFTWRGATASESGASEGRAVGLKPITRKL